MDDLYTQESRGSIVKLKHPRNFKMLYKPNFAVAMLGLRTTDCILGLDKVRNAACYIKNLSSHYLFQQPSCESSSSARSSNSSSTLDKGVFDSVAVPEDEIYKCACGCVHYFVSGLRCKAN